MLVKKIIGLFKNRNFILLLSIMMGLLVRNIGTWVKYLSIPALAIVMIVSLTQVSIKEIVSIKKVLIPTLFTVLFNFFIFGTVMLVLAHFLLDDKQLWIGFVILATAPPGVAIAPFAHIIDADEKFSIFGMVGTYIASLFLIPAAGLILIGKNFVNLLDLFIIFIELIIAPIIISQLIVKFKLDKHLDKWRGTIVNWGLFVVIFSVVYLNRSIFFKDYKTLLLISAIMVVSIFGSWIITNAVLRKIRTADKRRKSMVLAVTIKNSGFSAAAALSLFGDKASLPSAIFSIFIIVFLVIIGIRKKD